jgi:hypothetical protein
MSIESLILTVLSILVVIIILNALYIYYARKEKKIQLRPLHIDGHHFFKDHYTSYYFDEAV